MKKGFTLIELLVVISIVAILSALLMANFIGIRQRSRDATRKSDLQNIRQALELYRSDEGTYPASMDLSLPLENPDDGEIVYMAKIPRDPLTSGGSTDYSYAYNPTNNTYVLIACLENTGDTDNDTLSPDPDCQNSSSQQGTFRLTNP